MSLTKFQREYLMRCNHRWNVKTGATGSGKTFVDYSAVIPKRIMSCRGEGLIVLIGNTRGTLERNILDPMREMWGKTLVGEISNKNTVNLFGKKCYAIGADKKSQVAKIQGSTIEYVYGDEITTWSQEVFQMLKSRLRCEHSVFDGTCNPDSQLHWFKTFLDSDADIYQQSYTIDDGCLPEHVVTELKKEYAGTVYYARYILGQWQRAEGLVYPQFNLEKHVTTEEPENGVYYISVDYGTMNPFSAGLWCIHDGMATRVKEWYYNGRKLQRQKTDEEYYDAIVRLAGEHKIQAIVIDPSAASFITTIQSHHIFRAQKADNAVLDGIRTTSRLINAGRIQIHDSCKDIQREFGNYSWDDSKTEDTVIKEEDHAMDDMRYFCMTILRKKYRW